MATFLEFDVLKTATKNKKKLKTNIHGLRDSLDPLFFFFWYDCLRIRLATIVVPSGESEFVI